MSLLEKFKFCLWYGWVNHTSSILTKNPRTPLSVDCTWAGVRKTCDVKIKTTVMHSFHSAKTQTHIQKLWYDALSSDGYGIVCHKNTQHDHITIVRTKFMHRHKALYWHHLSHVLFSDWLGRKYHIGKLTVQTPIGVPCGKNGKFNCSKWLQLLWWTDNLCQILKSYLKAIPAFSVCAQTDEKTLYHYYSHAFVFFFIAIQVQTWYN